MLTSTDISRLAKAIVAATPKEDKVMDVEEASKYLCMSVPWIRQQIALKKIAYFHIGKKVRIMQSDLDSFLAAERSKTYVR